MPEENGLRVLVLAGAQLHEPLAAAGLSPIHFEQPQQLIKRARQVNARACVVRPAAEAVDIDALGDMVMRLRREVPFTDVIAWLPEPDMDSVRYMFRQGVKDIVFDDDPAVLASRLREVIDEQQYLPRLLAHRQTVAKRWRFEGMLSRSQRMWDLFELCIRTAHTGATVLILGETGTGKDLLARAFHRRSGRSGRMVAINCAAVPDNLIDSELFGHVRGAFTGASRDKLGLFRHAEGGTLLLDEIGDIPPPVQYRLLRVLQENRVRPVGSDQEIPVEVAMIAATSIQLDEAVRRQAFREDLLYRLDVIRVVVPPLRERPEDILFLYGHFIKKLVGQHGLPRPEVSEGFLDALQAYPWPGNVRQLENFCERLVLTHPHQRLAVDHFKRLVQPMATAEARPAREDAAARWRPDLDVPLQRAVEQSTARVEEAYLRAALDRHQGRMAETAAAAGISRRTLLRKLKHYGIDKEHYRRRSARQDEIAPGPTAS